MDKEDTNEDYSSVNCLPSEIITMILQNNDTSEILTFGSTCKHYNILINNNQYLWKCKFQNMIPSDMFDTVDKNTDGDWLGEIKLFYKTKKMVYKELLSMSPKHYRLQRDVSLEDLKNFFAIALTGKHTFYYVVYFLQDVIKKGNKNLQNFIAEKPFTITELFYAKIVLRHLMHTFLSVKWVRSHMRNELPPEIVLNYFLQWTDTFNMHLDENVEVKIMDIVQKVELLLKSNLSTKLPNCDIMKCRSEGLISEEQVLEAISQVIYHQRHMAITMNANLDTLDILKVLANKCGNVIVVAVVYQAVAKKFGVTLERVGFSNHLFLQWRRDQNTNNAAMYTIDLNTGSIWKKRRCPFSQHKITDDYKYCPDSLLQYIYSLYHDSMGMLNNWYTQNATHLLYFLGTNNSTFSPYRNFLPYLLDAVQLTPMVPPLDIKCLDDMYIEMIRALSNLNAPRSSSYREIVVKKRTPNIQFAVGMICYHKKYDFVCVIRAWDYTGNPELAKERLDRLKYGLQQPYYAVIAANQTPKYVPQENLAHLTRPCRLYHMEDLLAHEFSHFDGFAYVPNDEKRIEYPDDRLISQTYRNRSEIKD